MYYLTHPQRNRYYFLWPDPPDPRFIHIPTDMTAICASLIHSYYIWYVHPVTSESMCLSPSRIWSRMEILFWSSEISWLRRLQFTQKNWLA